jgi:hypothetical protein
VKDFICPDYKELFDNAFKKHDEKSISHVGDIYWGGDVTKKNTD